MDTFAYIADLFKYILAGTAVLSITWLLFGRVYFKQYLQLRMFEIKQQDQQRAVPMQLQAYERLILFVERIRPEELLLRELEGGMTAGRLREVLMGIIRQEFQHNITQQLYVSRQAWQTVRKLKEDTLTLIRQTNGHMADNMNGLELSKSILSHLSSLEHSPYDTALDLLKQEAGF